MPTNSAGIADEIDGLSIKDSPRDAANPGSARDVALHAQLQSVIKINSAVENIIKSLDKATTNMDILQNSVTSASSLLSTWTKILSQTEHNQRLLLDPEWPGATQDMEDMENLSIMRQQAAARKAADDQARRDEAQRRLAEEEARKSTTKSSARGRAGSLVGRARAKSSGYGRGSLTANTSAGHVGVGGQPGVGRGRLPTARGTGTGTAGRTGIARGRGSGSG